MLFGVRDRDGHRIKVIGLSGVKGCGKNTAGDFLVNSYGWDNYSFASPLKRACQEIFRLSDDQLEGVHEKEAVDPRWGVAPRKIFQKVGTELFREALSKEIPEIGADNLWIKSFLLWMDEKVKRDKLYNSNNRITLLFLYIFVCVLTVMMTLMGVFGVINASTPLLILSPTILYMVVLSFSIDRETKVVIYDVRFTNEAEFLKLKYNALIVKIDRRGQQKNADTHKSETQIDSIKEDITIFNNGKNINVYHDNIEAAIGQYITGSLRTTCRNLSRRLIM